MNWRWLRIPISYFFQAWLLKPVLIKCQRQGLLAYLKALQALRHGVIGGLLLLLFLQTLVIGLIGTTVVTVFLIIDDNQTRLWALFGIFALLSIIPLLVIVNLVSDRVWFRASGAAKLLGKMEE